MLPWFFRIAERLITQIGIVAKEEDLIELHKKAGEDYVVDSEIPV